MVIYATYANCDPYLKGVVASSNQVSAQIIKVIKFHFLIRHTLLFHPMLKIEFLS